MNTENSSDKKQTKALSQDTISGWFCYNCGCADKDFYLIVNHSNGNQSLYDDVCFYLDKTDEIIEFDICAECLVSV